MYGLLQVDGLLNSFLWLAQLCDCVDLCRHVVMVPTWVDDCASSSQPTTLRYKVNCAVTHGEQHPNLCWWSDMFSYLPACLPWRAALRGGSEAQGGCRVRRPAARARAVQAQPRWRAGVVKLCVCFHSPRVDWTHTLRYCCCWCCLCPLGLRDPVVKDQAAPAAVGRAAPAGPVPARGRGEGSRRVHAGKLTCYFDCSVLLPRFLHLLTSRCSHLPPQAHMRIGVPQVQRCADGSAARDCIKKMAKVILRTGARMGERRTD